MAKQRWKEIDILYCIGIFLVLIGHSHSNDWTSFSGTFFEKLIVFIYTFHMPLFFFISGFLFQDSDRIEIEGYYKWMRYKAVRLLTPYFFWITLAMLPKYVLSNHSFAGLNMLYLLNAWISPRTGILKYFWFIQVLFFHYAIFGLVRTAIKKRSVFLGLSLLLSVVLYFMPIDTEVLSFGQLRSMMIFFSFGAVFHELKRKPKWRGASVLFVIFSVFASLILTDMSNRVRAVALFISLLMIMSCWIIATAIKMSKTVEFFSVHNFTIYIFSWLFQVLVMALCDYFACGWVWTFVFMFLTGIAAPACIIMIYKKLLFLHKRPVQLILGIR